ncbi:MAG: site-specific integrase [Phycisphaerae bacterium]|jgi:integrase
MATVYRKIYPVPMPPGAEIIRLRGQRIARWIDGRGNEKTAPVTKNGRKILHEAGCWYGRFRGADGRDTRVSTGCHDEQAARKVLSGLLAEVDKVRAGILTPQESQAARHTAKPISDHVAAYMAYLAAKTVRGRKVSASHRYNVARQLDRLVAECGFRRIGDITCQRVTKWLGDQTDRSDKAPRTVLKYRASLTAFCKWAVREGRLAANLLARLPGVAIDEDRRKRRALTLAEITALLEAAATRPLRDALLIRRGVRKGQETAKVRPTERDRLIRLGRERALIYKTLIYSGLRKGELASLTVADLHLNDQHPYVELAAKNAKSGRGAKIPLRADLAAELREHLDSRLAQYRRQMLKDGRTEVPLALPGEMRLFDVPDDLVRIFDRDLAAAGIAKTDVDGKTVDVHSLRHTFATLLSKAGVVPRMAQELMRHSDIRLTMNTYTHLQLIDTAGAVELLPSVGLVQHETSPQVATGTNGPVGVA